MESLSREEMAAEDPFGGRGVFLTAAGMTGTEMLGRLASVTGISLPAVAWEGIGLWADPGSSRAVTSALLGGWPGAAEEGDSCDPGESG
jgi:hypothetical protein